MNKGYIPAETPSPDRKIPIRDQNGKGKELFLKDILNMRPKGKTKKDMRSIKKGAIVWGQQSDCLETDPKVILIEEFLDKGKRALRFGYWTVTDKEKLWWWGQSALMVPVEDIQELLKFAQEKGILSF